MELVPYGSSGLNQFIVNYDYDNKKLKRTCNAFDHLYRINMIWYEMIRIQVLVDITVIDKIFIIWR